MNTGKTHAYALRAAIDALNRWDRFGIGPTSAPRPELTIPDDDFVNRDADSWDGQAGLDDSPTPEPDLQSLY